MASELASSVGVGEYHKLNKYFRTSNWSVVTREKLRLGRVPALSTNEQEAKQ